MKCLECGEELNEKWAVCPFCGTKIPKPPKTIEEFLKVFVDDYGPSIFKEENSSRLERAMGDWPETYADDRDIIKLLQIKNIPDRLTSALDLASEEQGTVVQESANILCDKFGINGDFAAKMISLVTDAIGLKTDVPIGDGRGTFKDPRDGQVYKTCKIGDQIWLAENLKYETDKGCYVYYNDYKYLDQYGYLYSSDALSKAIPEGWHLPTEEEIRSMEKYIVKTNRCKYAIPFLLSKNWKGLDEYIRKMNVEDYSSIENLYGFSALPGGYGYFDSYGNISYDNGNGQYSRWWLQNQGIFSFFGNSVYDKIGINSNVRDTMCYIRLIKDRPLALSL